MRERTTPVNRALLALWRATREPSFRRDLIWRTLPRPPDTFQISGDTEEDRYPEIFRFVKNGLGDRRDLRLLSFGCSTGEELFTLRRYFPSAQIDGIDINPHRIRAARGQLRQRGGDPRTAVYVAGSSAQLRGGSYDAAFCMAVFRQGGLQLGPPPRCDHLITFATFERLVDDIARVLRPYGFLALAHSNFRFGDTRAAVAFNVAMRLDVAPPDPATPLYSHRNCLMPGATYPDVVFRKR